MPVYPGFGVNYQAAQANWAKDAAYFSVIKSPSAKFGLRIHLAQVPIPWSAGTPGMDNTADINAFWRSCAQYFSTNPNLYVIWGLAEPQGATHIPIVDTGNLTASFYAQYRTAVLAEAAYCQSIGLALGDFELGNELELFVDNVTLTVAQLNANLRQLATDVKAVYTLGSISYGCSTNSVAVADWVANGMGGLDHISFHPYGVTNVFNQTVNFTACDAAITSVVSAFGNKTYMSEFNVDSSNAGVSRLKVAPSVSNMASFLSFIRGTGTPMFFPYTWVGYLNGDNQFAQLYTNGSMNPVWFNFFASQGMIYTPRPNPPTRTFHSRTFVNRTVPTRYLIYS